MPCKRRGQTRAWKWFSRYSLVVTSPWQRRRWFPENDPRSAVYPCQCGREHSQSSLASPCCRSHPKRIARKQCSRLHQGSNARAYGSSKFHGRYPAKHRNLLQPECTLWQKKNIIVNNEKYEISETICLNHYVGKRYLYLAASYSHRMNHSTVSHLYLINQLIYWLSFYKLQLFRASSTGSQ